MTANPMFIIQPVFPFQKSQLYGPPWPLFRLSGQKYDISTDYFEFQTQSLWQGAVAAAKFEQWEWIVLSRDYSRATNLSITKSLPDFQRTSVQLLSKSVSPTHNTEQSRCFLAGQHLTVSLSQAGPTAATFITCSKGLRVAQLSATTSTCQDQSPQIQLGTKQLGFPVRSNRERVCAEICSNLGRCWCCYWADTPEQPLSCSVKGLDRQKYVTVSFREI